MIVVFALTNLLVVYVEKNEKWLRFSQFMFVAMVFCSFGDFGMRISLIVGVPLFMVGHVFYLLAMRSISPLLSRDDRPVFMKTIGIWAACLIATVLLLVFTVVNPAELVLSVGVGVYGILLGTTLAFAISKSLREYPIPFKIVLAFGFLFFLFSDWVIGVRELQDSDFLRAIWPTVIGTTYIIGQVLIHLTSQFRE
jgi:hypothetical protein